MLLLSIVVLALGGLLVVGLSGGVAMDILPQLPIAATVLTALIALYIATGRFERRRWWLLPLVALPALAAIFQVCWNGKAPPLATNLFASLPPVTESHTLQSNAPASVRIRRGADGGFRAHAEVNGNQLMMLVDTGASSVVLRGSDAERAGIEIQGLTYNTPLKTANGTVFVATVHLKLLRIGQVTAADVEALVAKPGTLNESLLGMSFLRRLESYEVAGDFVTLRQ